MITEMNTNRNADAMDWRMKLAILRHVWKESQRELADKAGVTGGTVNRWLAGSSEPKISQAIELARAFNLTLDQLFDENTPLPAHSTRVKVLSPADIAQAVSDAAAALARPSAPPQPPSVSARPTAETRPTKKTRKK